MYSRPFTVIEIKKHYPKIASKLLNDPVHKWRAETGIELIHEEPTKKELERTWVNWQEMDIEQKKLSDEKSLEYFGITNKKHYLILIMKY